MEDMELEELLNGLRQLDTSSYSEKDAKLGIRLSNIYRRIKLFYGDEAEMTIQSKLHVGTTIRITFPAQNHSE
ncbi:sensor histidine kinase YesM [Paenibacillus sp. V4I7]|nr:sensor histidine kinase YesM [Paenibacillus sp. V4I7]